MYRHVYSMQPCVQKCTQKRIHMCKEMCTHVHTHVYTCTCTHVYTCVHVHVQYLLYTSKCAVWNDALLSFRTQCYARVQWNSCLSGTLSESNDQLKVGTAIVVDLAKCQHNTVKSGIPSQHGHFRPFCPLLFTLSAYISIRKTCSILCPAQVLWPLWTIRSVPDTFRPWGPPWLRSLGSRLVEPR